MSNKRIQRPAGWFTRPDARDLFLISVTKTDTCWLWTGTRDKDGYGRVSVDGRQRAASRVAHLLLIGPIPDGHFVLHACDTPACVNPAHLRIGTPAENTNDAKSRGRLFVRLRAPYQSKGHYRRPSNWIDTPYAKEIFLRSTVRTDDGCLIWLGPKKPSGYGTVHVRGKLTGAHRAAYELFHGSIPSGAHVLHRCDLGACVSPDHLYLGDHAQNVRDAVERRRYQSGDKHWTHRYPNRVARGDRHLSRTKPESIPRGDGHWTHHPETCNRINTAAMRAVRAKLNEAQAIAIRTVAVNGVRSSDIAHQYNVAPRTIRDILNGKSWTHVLST